MEGKVKQVKRSVWEKGRTSDFGSHDIHAVRNTNTYAVLYNGDRVSINEDEIRRCYDCQRITDNIVSRLSDDMHDKDINYKEGTDGNYWLDDPLGRII